MTSIQERIMSTPGGEEAIERLKVSLRLNAEPSVSLQKAELGVNQHL